MKETIKMTAALVIFATISCVALAFVYDSTKPVIEARTASDTKSALALLFPAADSFDDISGSVMSANPAVRFLQVWEVVSVGNRAGLVFKAVSAGFNGDITVLVGVDGGGLVAGVSVLSHTETPGLGANAAKPAFADQFRGMRAGKTIAVKKDGGDVDALTSATITSRALARIVNETAKAAAAQK